MSLPSQPVLGTGVKDRDQSADLANWQQLAECVLQGGEISKREALQILEAPDEELLAILAAAFRVRRKFFGKKVQLYFLMNAKSGLCPEDCGYCSQSRVATSEIPRYNLLGRDQVLEAARIASESQAGTFCIVISARGPNDREMQAVADIVPEIKRRFDLKVCACLGLLTPEQAQQLKECGVDRVNHNINSSEGFYEEICTTHSFHDRLETLDAVRGAGLELCSGGIVGMGETLDDVVEMAIRLRTLGVHSIPVNFLIPVPGTPLAAAPTLNPRACLKVLAMFRLTNPGQELRIAGGRELQLRSLQPLGLYAANSIFVGDYLTTRGQPPEADYQMIEDLGFEVVGQAVNAPGGCATV